MNHGPMNARHAHCSDCDASFLLHFERIEDLLISIAIGLGSDCPSQLQQPVRQGRLSVIYLYCAISFQMITHREALTPVRGR